MLYCDGIIWGSDQREGNLLTDVELLEYMGQVVEMSFVVSFWDAHGEDFFHVALVEKKGKRCPPTESCHNFRRYSCKEELNSATYVEAVAKDMHKHGWWPNTHDELEHQEKAT